MQEKLNLLEESVTDVNVVLIVVAVIKKEPKRKHTQKQSFAIPTVNRLNFRKLNISKKKCGNAIK